MLQSFKATPEEMGVDSAILKKIDNILLDDITDGRNYGASLLIARKGKIIHTSFLGNSASNRQTNCSDRYLLMSMSKFFTAIMVLRAIDAGWFDLDTKVCDIAPEFAYGGKQDVTIRQLLCHTGGLPTTPIAPPLKLTDIGHLKRHFDAIALLEAVYIPGSRCAYTSGTGYDTLGQLLVMTDPKKRSFREIAQDEVFIPLGMLNTSFGLSTKHPDRVPVSFTPSATTQASPLMMHAFNECLDENAEYPCAGAFSDLADLFTFTEAIAGRNKPTNYQMISPKLFDIAKENATGSMALENIPPKGSPSFALDLSDQEKYPAHFTLLGGYTRGKGNIFSPAGESASAETLVSDGWGINRLDI